MLKTNRFARTDSCFRSRNVQHGIGGGQDISTCDRCKTEDVSGYLREWTKVGHDESSRSVRSDACVACNVCWPGGGCAWSSVRIPELCRIRWPEAKTADDRNSQQWLKNLDKLRRCVGQPVPRTLTTRRRQVEPERPADGTRGLAPWVAT